MTASTSNSKCTPYTPDLRNLFDPELSDMEARYRWLYRQPDLDHADNTRALFRIWLEDIAAEWRRRERHNLQAPAPSMASPMS